MNRNSFTFSKLLNTIEIELKTKASLRISETLKIAIEGHKGQFRASRNEMHKVPYIVHPVGTAILAIKLYETVDIIKDDLETVVCIALSHDLIEDTRITISMLENVAGKHVREYVESLTKPTTEALETPYKNRNECFLNQIIEAGPTAIFIKICDSMHNLKRPASTPTKLLKKIINKAKEQYLPLLLKYPFGEIISETYRMHLRDAINVLESEQQYNAVDYKKAPNNLQEAITECTIASSNKILEVHDLAELVQFVCSSSGVIIWRYNSDTKSLTVQFATKDNSKTYIEIPEASGLLENSQILPQELAIRFGGAQSSNRPITVFTVPMTVDASNVFLVSIDYEQNIPNWITPAVTQVVVQFLAHRLIVSSIERRSELAHEAAKYGIRLDPNLALRVGVHASHIERLHNWLDCCAQAVQAVKKDLLQFVSNLKINEKIKTQIQILHRIKEPDSIFQKILMNSRYIWSDIQNIEDIAGVRVICPNQSSLNIIDNYLTKENNGGNIKLHPKFKRPRRDYITKPTKHGYRAIHLILSVDTFVYGEGSLSVPCEVQLRTVFQDLWAKISHATLYQTTRAERRKLSKHLRDMWPALEDCEKITEKLLVVGTRPYNRTRR